MSKQSWGWALPSSGAHLGYVPYTVWVMPLYSMCYYTVCVREGQSPRIKGNKEPSSKYGFNKWGRFWQIPHNISALLNILYNYIYSINWWNQWKGRKYLTFKEFIFINDVIYALNWGRLTCLNFGSREGQTVFLTLGMG